MEFKANDLEQYIQSYFGLHAGDLHKMVSFFESLELKKGQYFLRAGHHADRLGFLLKGIVREYLEEDATEITKWIATPSSFITDLSGFVFQQRARVNLCALTDCELFVIHRKNYLQLGSVIPKWHELEKMFLSGCFRIIEDRIVMHLSKSAEARYQILFHQKPDFFNQVPLQYLTSMLGMTPETFSRIRKKAILKTGN
jgi:CRP-like cAMP-binding protein